MNSREKQAPISVFYSYSHKDEDLRLKLEDHLASLRWSGMISEWHDRDIDVGQEWEKEIDRHLSSADIILLLVSASFIASKYCWSVEVEKALKRHQCGEARVLPVILRPCRWGNTPFAKLQAAPKDGKAVTAWADQDAAFDDVASKIERVVRELRARRRRKPSSGPSDSDAQSGLQRSTTSDMTPAQIVSTPKKERSPINEAVERHKSAADRAPQVATTEPPPNADTNKDLIGAAVKSLRWLVSGMVILALAGAVGGTALWLMPAAEKTNKTETTTDDKKPSQPAQDKITTKTLAGEKKPAQPIPDKTTKNQPTSDQNQPSAWAGVGQAKAPKVFKDCDVCPEMVFVPMGSFLMGSPPGEEGRSDDEGPQHAVALKSFAIGRYEVTFDEWNTCVAAGGCNGYHPDDHGWGQGKRPVINVSWRDARTYADWLAKKAGKAYRLPSEAEWEYACRAGTTTPFYFGATINTAQANYDGTFTYVGSPKGVDRQMTIRVGSFPGNAFGIYDMHGNVREWVEDLWHDSYSGAPIDGSAWTDRQPIYSFSYLIVRGGDWAKAPISLRSATRGRANPDLRDLALGFRVALTLD